MPAPADASDEELLRRSRQDPEAFARLYDRYAGPIAGWLARRAHPDAAQELFAETFAQAWCDRHRFRPSRGSAAGWLYGIAQHLLHGSYRRLAVEDRGRRRLGLDPAHVEADTDGADARLDAADLRATLRAALGDLSPAVRDAVLLRVIEQRDYREIADALGCSTQSARVRVSRGLRALRAHADVLPPHPVPPARGATS
jgi:RNA polymerase sigma-70 factor (ECF subfamily)